MKIIKLTKGLETIVDDNDYTYLSQFKWCSSHGYAVTLDPKNWRKQLRMQRIILNAKKGEFVDHINMNPLDNRRENLRVCTKAENMRNRLKQKNNSSGFKGIGWDKEREKWKIQIKAGNIRFLKRVETLEEAIVIHSQKLNSLHKDFARREYAT